MLDVGTLSTTQKGKVTEYLVASALTLASGGRISPFVPLSDDDGIDLIVMDKASQRLLPLQVKSAVASQTRRTIQFDIRKATYSEAANRHLVAIHFDPEKGALAGAWFIPMARVPQVSVEQAGKYALTPSTSPTSRDRYRDFYCADAKDLAAAVLKAINGAGAASIG